jgi:hypothetical protein
MNHHQQEIASILSQTGHYSQAAQVEPVKHVGFSQAPPQVFLSQASHHEADDADMTPSQIEAAKQ